jgi:hypothetical protein
MESTFEYGPELEQALLRQQEINTELGLNKNDEQLVDEGTEETETVETPEAKESLDAGLEGEKEEEPESEQLIDLDAIVSADAEWDWLTDGQVEWEMDRICAPSAELLEAIENLDLASFKLPELDNSLLETLPEEPLFEPIDPPKSSLSPPEEAIPLPEIVEGSLAPNQGEPASQTQPKARHQESAEAPATVPAAEAIIAPKEAATPPEPTETAVDQAPPQVKSASTVPVNTSHQQLTLFPGQFDEPKRKRSASRKQSSQPEQRLKQPTASDNPVPAARSRLSGFASDFGALAGHSEEPVKSTGSALQRDEDNIENLREPTASPGKLFDDREAAQPELSVVADPIAGISPTDPPTERPTAALRNLNEAELEPSPERDTEICESTEPDPSEVERDRVESQNDSDRVPRISLEREPIEFIIHPDESEREIHSGVGENERTPEQSGNPDEEIPQTSQLEAIALQWTDTELLTNEQKVKAYFTESLPEPDWAEGRRLQDEVKRCSKDWHQASSEARDCKQKVDELGEPRSLWYPLGSPPQEVEAARTRYEEGRLNVFQAEQHLEQAQIGLKGWQQPAQRYQEWRHGPEGKQMHEMKAIVELEPVQERLTQIHAVQKQRKGLEVLGQWERVAIASDRPENYLQRIREITAEFTQGVSVPEKAIDAMTHDYEAYQQKQTIQQQPRHKGFSL